MSYHSRRFFMPGASRKRKEREAFYSSKPLSPVTSTLTAVNNFRPTTSYKGHEPLSSNRLLAGYLACEFLTKGTLFGQKFDPARAEAMPVSNNSLAESKRSKPYRMQAEPSMKVKPQKQSYSEVANLLKSDGAHIPGIVNPTQLARWIQM